jgi:hypothetical protein
MKIDNVRARREELKRLLFSTPTEGRKVTKTITVTMNTNKEFWIGYGYVSIDRDGPDGFCHFATHQEFPMHYVMNSKEYKSGEYKLIVK